MSDIFKITITAAGKDFKFTGTKTVDMNLLGQRVTYIRAHEDSGKRVIDLHIFNPQISDLEKKESSTGGNLQKNT